MPNIRLPDGSSKSFPGPVTVAEIAASIGAGLARAALAAKVNGRLVDTSTRVDADADVQIVTERDPEGLEILRHSTAHLLAQAVKELFPEAQVTIGPVIENGFYYDFRRPEGFSPDDLARIEDTMRAIVKEDLPVRREEVDKAETIVDQEVRRFTVRKRSERLAPLIKALRERGDVVLTSELGRFRSELSELTPDERQAVEALARGIVSKLLHDPIVRLKELSGPGNDATYARVLAELFAVEHRPE